MGQTDSDNDDTKSGPLTGSAFLRHQRAAFDARQREELSESKGLDH